MCVLPQRSMCLLYFLGLISLPHLGQVGTPSDDLWR